MPKKERDILDEAIADAKLVKEVALQNAKDALTEAFEPTLKHMLSQKIKNEEIDDEDEEDEEIIDDEEEEEIEELEDNEVTDDELDMPNSEDIEDDEVVIDDELEEEEDMDIGNIEDDEENKDIELPLEDEEEEEDIELEQLIRELEDEEEIDLEDDEEITESDDDNDDDELGIDLEDDEEITEEEEVDLEIEDEEDPKDGEIEELKTELKRYHEAVEFLRFKLNETKLINTKLLYINKMFKDGGLTKRQKLDIVENFDRAKTVREVKIIYATLKESTRAKKLTLENRSSKAIKVIKPKTILKESKDPVKTRYQKLAGIKNKK